MFCAGADLKAINAGNARRSAPKRGGFAGFVYRERRKPIIVAVDGLATAGGCEIVLAADLVVATTRSSFGLAEVKRNLDRRRRRPVPPAAGHRPGGGDGGDPHRRADPGRSGPTSSASCRASSSPGEAVAEARRLAEQICLSAPLAVWESRAVVRAAAYEDDETLKAMTNEAMARRDGLRGPQGGPHRVHREAPAELEGPLTLAGDRLSRAVARR